jgi:hypothetical protein
MLAGELINSLIRKKMVKRPARFVGKLGKTLNNGKATPKARQHIQDVGRRNT